MKKYNSKARFEYQLLDKFESGIVLTGAEAKAVNSGHVDLSQSFARFIKGELYLINANIYVQNVPGADSKRSRKLLMHKRELESLHGQLSQKKLTIVPLSVYTKGRLVKLELALARSKRKFEKREALKQKDIKRDIERELR